MSKKKPAITVDLKRCVTFHGHLCPGLVYGYLVAREAKRLLGRGNSLAEDLVAICENDSCAVDAIQALLGSTLGKGNLILKNYGKHVFTIVDRISGRAIRFSRKKGYDYQGACREEFAGLEKKYIEGTMTGEEKKRHKLLKVSDLLERDFRDVFSVSEVELPDPPRATVVESLPCGACGEMTMSSRLVKQPETAGEPGWCLPCIEDRRIK